ncbi:hypothetical protein P7K49_015190 [Saguinus oedipus]|uniref:PI-PLC Y-box domain-containing protein n=1 Tax=Saguinus oedipus TaxID=9490 RepID=A0ABQ9V8V5_SAGOE|nr:hypothetical protein P7K49_015190 [Saguinus oedipus]
MSGPSPALVEASGHHSYQGDGGHTVDLQQLCRGCWCVVAGGGGDTPGRSVALNYQSEGRMLQLNRAKFSANGGCGYVLKPEW